jgi:hypothetical protein
VDGGDGGEINSSQGFGGLKKEIMPKVYLSINQRRVRVFESSLYAIPHLLVQFTTKKEASSENVLKSLLEKVADYSGFSIEDIKRKCRKRDLVFARHLYFFLSSYLCKSSLKDIGKSCNVDHTTVMHGRAMFENFLMLGDAKYIQAVQSISPDLINMMQNKHDKMISNIRVKYT